MFGSYRGVGTRVGGGGGGGGGGGALFVQANVAGNTKLTSKVPFLFGNFDVF
jgi:hypothetical protein